MGALPKPDQLYTYADYESWELAEGERYELIYGEAFAMAAPNELHQLILGELFAQFHVYLRGRPCKVFPAPYDVRLFYAGNKNDDTVVQPDITVVCNGEKRGSEGCRGAPSLVVEILSPSNTATEMQRKFSLYKKAGVREYWVVDPETKEVTVFLFGENPGFNVYKSMDVVPVAVLPGLNILLEQVFAE